MPWQDAYANPGTNWGVKDAAHPNGHRGKDYKLPAGSVVPAYERCAVVSTPYSPILGYCTVARLDNGQYVGWAHLRTGTRPAVGAVLNPGSSVGVCAGWGDDHGTAWTGPHIHTTYGPILSHIFAGTTYDPGPRIRAALIDAAGTGYAPIDTQEEDDMTPAQEAKLDLILRLLPGEAGVKGEGVYFRELRERTTATLQQIDRLTPGIAGIKTDGEAYTLLKTILAQIDRLTPGIVGKKFDGEAYATLKAVQANVAALTSVSGAKVDPAELAKALAPYIVTALGADVATSGDLADLKADLLAAIAGVDEETLATFGLKRA